MQGVALDELGMGIGVLLIAPAGDLEHLVAEIQPGDCGALPREREGNIARAAAEIERGRAGWDPGQADNLPLPTPMEAETLKVIDQVIAPGNGGKQIVHLGGPFIAGLIKCIAHPVSLTGCSRNNQNPSQAGRVLPCMCSCSI